MGLGAPLPGLFMAAHLIVIGVTGSIITFNPELMAWLNPPPTVTEGRGEAPEPAGAARGRGRARGAGRADQPPAAAPEGRRALHCLHEPGGEGAGESEGRRAVPRSLHRGIVGLRTVPAADVAGHGAQRDGPDQPPALCARAAGHFRHLSVRRRCRAVDDRLLRRRLFDSCRRAAATRPARPTAGGAAGWPAGGTRRGSSSAMPCSTGSTSTCTAPAASGCGCCCSSSPGRGRLQPEPAGLPAGDEGAVRHARHLRRCPAGAKI